MAVIIPFGRALTRQSILRSNHLLTRLASSNSFHCASQSNTNSKENGQRWNTCFYRQNLAIRSRAYATAATSKPASRPKAHTGKAPAKKSGGRSKPKSTTTKKKTTVKKKARPKAKPKATKKATKKAAKKAPSKTSANRARIAKNKDLKAKALLEEPKQLPSNAWALYFAQDRSSIKVFSEAAERTKIAAREFKALPSEELEKLNHTANENKRKNEAAYKQWVSQYTPVEIKEANNARKTLSKEKKVKEGKKKASVRLIKDDRLVKQPVNGYSYFVKDRFASGDFKHMALAEASKLIGREWKALSAEEKKPYQDQQHSDHNRYVEEATTVYGQAPSKPK